VSAPNLNPSRELLRVVTEGTPIFPTPRDKGRCSETRFIVNQDRCYVVTLNGRGTQVLHEPIDPPEVRTRGLQMWVDIYEHTLRSPFVTEKRVGREK
jgi:hypothetical protein